MIKRGFQKPTQKAINNRRRFLQIAASFLLVPSAAASMSHERKRIYRGQGEFMGAETEISIYCEDESLAMRTIENCFRKAAKLENLFSLHKNDSTIRQFNRVGYLENPPKTFVHLLRKANSLSVLTDGKFDITVQPLWDFYHNQFKSSTKSKPELSSEIIRKTVNLVDYEKLFIEDNFVSFGQQGMAITLNGIAQGYITDEITGFLKNEGFKNVLVDMGETFGLGKQKEGKPWQVGIANPNQPWQSFMTVPLRDCAIATSGGYGTPFDIDGKYHHLFIPRKGISGNFYKSLSVIAPSATVADGLSTGLYVTRPERIADIVKQFASITVIVLDQNNRKRVYKSMT